MAARPFVALTLPARDTILGALSAIEGVRFTGVARRSRYGKEPAVDVVLHATGINAGIAAALATRLRNRSLVWGAVADGDLETWSATFTVPWDALANTSLRVVADPRVLPAWFVIEDGLTGIRLRPSHGRADVLLQDLSSALQGEGLQWGGGIEAVDEAPYLAEVALLEAAFPAPAVREVIERPVRRSMHRLLA